MGSGTRAISRHRSQVRTERAAGSWLQTVSQQQLQPQPSIRQRVAGPQLYSGPSLPSATCRWLPRAALA